MQTLAVGGSPAPERPVARLSRPDKANINEPVISQEESDSSSILDSPLFMIAVGILVVVLAGFSSWAIVRSLRDNELISPQTPPEPQTFPSPVISGGTTPEPSLDSEEEEKEPVIVSKRLRFDFSNTSRVEGTIKTKEIHQYTFLGKQDQVLSVLINEAPGISITILGSNRKPIDDNADSVTFYEGILPSPGKYTIQVKTTQEFEEVDYQLRVNLQDPVIPEVKPTPTIPTQRPPRNAPEIPSPLPKQEQQERPELIPEIIPIPQPETEPETEGVPPVNTPEVIPTEPEIKPQPLQPPTDLQPETPSNLEGTQSELPESNETPTEPLSSNQGDGNIYPDDEKVEFTEEET